MVLFVWIVRSKLRGALTAALSGEETVYSNYAITHDAFSSDLTVDYRHSKILIVQSHEAKQVFSIKFSNPPNPSDWTSRGWWPPKALSPPQPPHSANPTHSNHPRTLPPQTGPCHLSISCRIMARGNQREKAREKTQKAAGASKKKNAVRFPPGKI
jgi:hypothetical protein